VAIRVFLPSICGSSTREINSSSLGCSTTFWLSEISSG
jgi:hypothetical protein